MATTRPPVHPWALWLNGETHTLRNGVDYFCSDDSIRQYASRKAKAVNKTVSCYLIHPGCLMITAMKRRQYTVPVQDTGLCNTEYAWAGS